MKSIVITIFAAAIAHGVWAELPAQEDLTAQDSAYSILSRPGAATQSRLEAAMVSAKFYNKVYILPMLLHAPSASEIAAFEQLFYLTSNNVAGFNGKPGDEQPDIYVALTGTSIAVLPEVVAKGRIAGIQKNSLMPTYLLRFPSGNQFVLDASYFFEDGNLTSRPRALQLPPSTHHLELNIGDKIAGVLWKQAVHGRSPGNGFDASVTGSKPLPMFLAVYLQVTDAKNRHTNYLESSWNLKELVQDYSKTRQKYVRSLSPRSTRPTSALSLMSNPTSGSSHDFSHNMSGAVNWSIVSASPTPEVSEQTKPTSSSTTHMAASAASSEPTFPDWFVKAQSQLYEGMDPVDVLNLLGKPTSADSYTDQYGSMGCWLYTWNFGNWCFQANIWLGHLGKWTARRCEYNQHVVNHHCCS